MGWTIDEALRRLTLPPAGCGRHPMARTTDRYEKKVAESDPTSQFGAIVKLRYGLSTRNLNAMAAALFKAGRQPDRSLRGYHRDTGVVYNWSEGVPTVPLTARMTTTLYVGTRRDVRKSKRLKDTVSFDSFAAWADHYSLQQVAKRPDLAPGEQLDERSYGDSRIGRAAAGSVAHKGATRPNWAVPIDPDLLLWEDFLASKADTITAWAEAHGIPKRTAQHRLAMARTRLIARDPKLAVMLPEARAGRPREMRKVAGVRGEGSGPAPRVLPTSPPDVAA